MQKNIWFVFACIIICSALILASFSLVHSHAENFSGFVSASNLLISSLIFCGAIAVGGTLIIISNLRTKNDSEKDDEDSGGDDQL